MKVAVLNRLIYGVEYELAVRDEAGGYFATWFCRACWKGGVQYNLLPTITEAMADAEQRVIEHHKTEHGTN